MILQMFPISLHVYLVPNEIKRWNRLERFFLRRSQPFTNLFFPTLPFRAQRGRHNRDNGYDSGPVFLWRGLTGLSAKTRRHVFFTNGASIRNNVNYCCYILFERENIMGRGLFCSVKVTETREILS